MPQLQFIKWFKETIYPSEVRLPTGDHLTRSMATYTRLGFPGAYCETDGVHVTLRVSAWKVSTALAARLEALPELNSGPRPALSMPGLVSSKVSIIAMRSARARRAGWVAACAPMSGASWRRGAAAASTSACACMRAAAARRRRGFIETASAAGVCVHECAVQRRTGHICVWRTVIALLSLSLSDAHIFRVRE